MSKKFVISSSSFIRITKVFVFLVGFYLERDGPRRINRSKPKKPRVKVRREVSLKNLSVKVKVPSKSNQPFQRSADRDNKQTDKTLKLIFNIHSFALSAKLVI